MATSTTRLGLSKPDGADIVDIAVLNSNADKLDTAAGAYMCTSSTRPTTPWNGQVIYETDTYTALVYRTASSSWIPVGGSTVASTAPAIASSGDLWWDSDTGRLYVYYSDGNSSQWVAASNSSTNTVGLVPVIASTVSISGGTATSNSLGMVSFSGATSILMNNVFTSTYKNYYIEINFEGSSTSTGVYFRLCSGGTIDTGSIYYYTFAYNSTGAVSGLGGAPASAVDIAVIYNNGTAPGHGGTSIELRNPKTSNYANATFRGINSRSGTVEQRSGGFHTSTTTSYDGLYLYPSTGTFTGTIQVFGYNNS